MSGPLCGPQRSKQARMSDLSSIPLVLMLMPSPVGQSLAMTRHFRQAQRVGPLRP
jgi:hypothetical protein